MKKIALCIIILPLLFLMACSDNHKSESSSQKLVFTSILPQKFFVEQIAGDKLEVEVMVQPGKSPATYEPLPEQVMRLSDAAIFFKIGVPFEKAFLPKISKSLPQLKIVDTSAGIEKRYLQKHSHSDGSHHAHQHQHEPQAALDPHIWLSPLLVKSQAAIIYETLVDLDPENSEFYHQNYQDFLNNLEQLHLNLVEIMEPVKGETILVFHPSFGYFTDLYGLEQIAIESGGKEPSPAHLQEVIQQAKDLNSRVIITQPEFSLKSAELIAKAIEGSVISLNPLDPDYFFNLKNMATKIVESSR